jgi:hypothetical protein
MGLKEVSMELRRNPLAACGLLLALGGVAAAQNVISAKAGLINAADGDVFLADKQVKLKAGELTDLKAGEVLRTDEGRTEVLLTPGSYLRMLESSSFRLENAKLDDVRVTVLTGSAMVEVDELLDGNHLTVLVNGAEVALAKAGLYRFDTDPFRIRVYEGEANVTTASGQYTMKKSRQLLAADSGYAVSKFDTDDTDALYRWSRRRGEYIAMANRSSARMASAFASAWPGRMSGWYFNPYFGTMTFLPMAGSVYSPFGYYYYTPFTVYQAYVPAYHQQGSGRVSGVRGPATSPSAGFAQGPYGAGSVGSARLPSRSGEASFGYSSAPASSSGSVGSAAASASPRGGEGAGARGGGAASGGRHQ